MAGFTSTGEAIKDSSEVEMFVDEIITPGEAEKLLSRNLVPNGQYTVQVLKASKEQPTESKPGGYMIPIRITAGPSEQPQGGWPPQSIKINKFLNPSEGQRQNEQIARKDLTRLLACCGVDFKVGAVDPWTALQSIEGVHFLATANQRPGKDKITKELNGEKYQEWKSFKPL